MSDDTTQGQPTERRKHREGMDSMSAAQTYDRAADQVAKFETIDQAVTWLRRREIDARQLAAQRFLEAGDHAKCMEVLRTLTGAYDRQPAQRKAID